MYSVLASHMEVMRDKWGNNEAIITEHNRLFNKLKDFFVKDVSKSLVSNITNGWFTQTHSEVKTKLLRAIKKGVSQEIMECRAQYRLEIKQAKVARECNNWSDLLEA